MQAAEISAGLSPDWLLLAGMLSVFALHAAIEIVQSLRQKKTHLRAWRLGAASAVGFGIWCGAFMSWRALLLPTGLGFDPTWMLAALSVAVVTAMAGMAYANLAAPRTLVLVLAALIVGSGLCAVQMLGVMAIEVRPTMSWQLTSLVAAWASAIAIAAAGLGLSTWLLQNGNSMLRFAGALLVSVALLAMQVASLRAARFPIDGYSTSLGSFDSSTTALLIAALGLSVTMLFMRLAAGDTRLQQMLREEQLLREQEERARMLALHDPETMLRNRASFQQEAVQFIRRGTRDHRIFDLFYGSLRFPQLNGSEGEAMRLIAERLRPLAGPHDFLARYGKTEFALLRLRDNNEAPPAQLRELLTAACTLPLQIDAQVITPLAHIGCGTFPEDGLSPRELLTAAARSSGRTPGPTVPLKPATHAPIAAA